MSQPNPAPASAVRSASTDANSATDAVAVAEVAAADDAIPKRDLGSARSSPPTRDAAFLLTPPFHRTALVVMSMGWSTSPTTSITSSVTTMVTTSITTTATSTPSTTPLWGQFTCLDYNGIDYMAVASSQCSRQVQQVNELLGWSCYLTHCCSQLCSPSLFLGRRLVFLQSQTC